MEGHSSLPKGPGATPGVHIEPLTPQGLETSKLTTTRILISRLATARVLGFPATARALCLSFFSRSLPLLWFSTRLSLFPFYLSLADRATQKRLNTQKEGSTQGHSWEWQPHWQGHSREWVEFRKIREATMLGAKPPRASNQLTPIPTPMLHVQVVRMQKTTQASIELRLIRIAHTTLRMYR